VENRVSDGLKIGEGFVFHSRHTDASTKFKYPTFFLHFDVDQEPELHRRFRSQFFGCLSLSARDYLNGETRPLGQAIREFVQTRMGYEAEEIWLQTMPRILGYVFNPVNFWIFKKSGQVDAVLCEVNNTFGERHFYWIKSATPMSWHTSLKEFHVSPFQPTSGYYNYRFQFSDQNSSVDINYFGSNHELRLTTWIKGDLAPLEQKSLFKLLMRYGWMTAFVVFRIHLQAVILWLKKVRYVPKPALPEKEVTDSLFS
jgi:DUF1365 family protein